MNLETIVPVPPNTAGETRSLVRTLTRSELSCLSLTASGFSVDGIARKLSMARHEVEMLLFCAERKLNAENRLHAVTVAAGLGLLECDD
jgi:DNA-binding CsgD family transcriptional regulator